MFSNIKLARWTYVYFIILLALLSLSVGFSDSQNSLRLNLRNGVFDKFNKLYPRESSGKVIIVDIDEASLERLGRWPWPRNILAKLIKSLTEKGATAIAFDGVFAEEDRSSPHYFINTLPSEQADLLSVILKDESYDYDKYFASEIKKSKIFITAFSYGREDRSNIKPLNKKRILARSDVIKIFLEEASYFNAAAVNLPEFSKNAAGNGSFMAEPDPDGVLRRVAMIFTDKENLYPSLSLEAVRVSSLGRKGTMLLNKLSFDSRNVIDTDYRIKLGNIGIPVDSDGILYVHYRDFCNAENIKNHLPSCSSQDYVSAYKILDPQHDMEVSKAIDGKIVLIGASAEGLKDLRSTPLQAFIPGVEVHANVIEQVMAGEYLLRPAIINGVEAFFIITVGLIFIIFLPFIGILISILLCGAIICIAVFGAYYVYVEYGVLVDPVYPSLSVLMIFIVSTILSYARAEAKRKQIRNAFGMYVAHDVMSDLEKHPERLKLGGENRDITIMFTDIRKFTSISEGLSPEDLIQLINEFLTAMTDIVMSHHGTVDKYIGDAMMAFWNAPKYVDNHERSACLAALEMQVALEPVNKKLREKAQEDGREPLLLNAGIGINSGICAVGNMGSKQRFAYSALGDAVNLSARLEGQTKLYGVDILVGQSAYEQASDLAMIELDLIKVIGRTQPVRIYALFGDNEVAKSQEFIDWKSLHMQMLGYYLAQDFDKALDLVIQCKGASKEQGAHLYDMYKERIEQLKSEDLPSDWDGVFVAQSK